MSQKLLTEASRFAHDTLFDVADHDGGRDGSPHGAGNAVERGWLPLAVPGRIAGGVDRGEVTGFLADTPLKGPTLSTAAHFYTGELDGRQTLVMAYRGTDEGPLEFAFQGLPLPSNPSGARFGWDLYAAEHAEASASALDVALDPTNGIEQILVTGHSLGGIIAELSAVRLMGPGQAYETLANRTLVATFGSPGSTESAANLNQVNIVHSDDLVPRLSDLSSLFGGGDAAREGVDIVVERPEATLPDFEPNDLNGLRELLDATGDESLTAEHQIELYIETAGLLDRAAPFVTTATDAADQPVIWLGADLDRTIISGPDAATLVGGPGNDILVGGLGDDVLAGGAGDDIILPGGGNTRVDGGPGLDTALFDGARDSFTIIALDDVIQVSRSSDEAAVAELRNIERLAFDDQTIPVGEVAGTAVAAAGGSLDDLVVAAEVG